MLLGILINRIAHRTAIAARVELGKAIAFWNSKTVNTPEKLMIKITPANVKGFVAS